MRESGEVGELMPSRGGPSLPDLHSHSYDTTNPAPDVALEPQWHRLLENWLKR